MSTTWKLQGVTERAIVKLEGLMLDEKGKPANELVRYGAPEHVTVIRYGVLDILGQVQEDSKKDPKLDATKEFNRRLKEWLDGEANFLAISSNAKKLLADIDDGKAYPKLVASAKQNKGYE